MSDAPQPPPKGRGVFGKSAPAPPVPPPGLYPQPQQQQVAQPLRYPPNRFGENIKAGFGLGIGIWLAFAMLSFVLWFGLAVLIGLASLS